MFALHLSRPTLVAIMLISMAAISALNLTHKDPDEFTVEALKLAPLPKSYWRQWPTPSDSIWNAHWQQQASQQIAIQLRTSSGVVHSWQLQTETWSQEIKTILQQEKVSRLLKSSDRIGMAISGPLAEAELRWLLAAFDHHLRVDGAIRTSVVNHPESGKVKQRLAQELPQQTNQQPSQELPQQTKQQPAQELSQLHPQCLSRSSNKGAINLSFAESSILSQIQWTTASWNQQRQQLAQQLRYRWLEPSEQFDIQAELAYHRLAPNWFDKLYSELANLSPQALLPWLNCQLSS